MYINHEKVNEIVRLSQGVSPLTQRLFALIISYKDKEKTQEYKRFGSFKAVCEEFAIKGVGETIENSRDSGKSSRGGLVELL